LYDAARACGLQADPAESVDDALLQTVARWQQMGIKAGPRIVICGSLYLAGQVLRENG
ncbi:MAG TPA: bifunctional folylpolyglutamate synthase/dihydrofolate synthase, partial [Alphaproteobacteria bacterium]|nr:bifunctional folylpolyglutamate synthase/dihydrofolate synthase [Alphaproteobacteria bacterium]